MRKVKVGLVGCGNICDIYFQNAMNFKSYEIVACADIVRDKALEKAKQYNIPKVCTLDEMCEDKEIETILNLTIPQAHSEVMLKGLCANKNVYTEKPLALSFEEGRKVIELAEKKNLRVGCAPDTFLGGRIQTIRKFLDEGRIGHPIAITSFMPCPGHEFWHPSPDFYYKTGGGPLFDMGPYHITAMIYLLGPVKRVCGAIKTTYGKREIKNGQLQGEIINVGVPTHISATLEFYSGAVGSLILSFDIWDSNLPKMELYGSDGVFCMNEGDPYGGPGIFGGELLFRSKEKSDWLTYPEQVPRNNKTSWDVIPSVFGYNENSRGVGLADMAHAQRSGRDHRANGYIALHTLEIMCGIEIAAKTGNYYELQSTFNKPSLLPIGLGDFELDE